MLIHLYSANTTPDKGKKPAKFSDTGRTLPNGHVRGHSATERQARDVQEFELEALMSEDEDEHEGGKSNQRSEDE